MGEKKTCLKCKLFNINLLFNNVYNSNITLAMMLFFPSLIPGSVSLFTWVVFVCFFPAALSPPCPFSYFLSLSEFSIGGKQIGKKRRWETDQCQFVSYINRMEQEDIHLSHSHCISFCWNDSSLHFYFLNQLSGVWQICTLCTELTVKLEIKCFSPSHCHPLPSSFTLEKPFKYSTCNEILLRKSQIGCSIVNVIKARLHP